MASRYWRNHWSYKRDVSDFIQLGYDGNSRNEQTSMDDTTVVIKSKYTSKEKEASYTRSLCVLPHSIKTFTKLDCPEEYTRIETRPMDFQFTYFSYVLLPSAENATLLTGRYFQFCNLQTLLTVASRQSINISIFAVQIGYFNNFLLKYN